MATIFADTGVFVLYEEDVAGWQAQTVSSDTLEATPLPAPPLMPRETFMLGRAQAPAQAAIGIVRDKVISILLLDEGATSWRAVEGPSQITIVDPTSISQLVVHDDRIYAVIDGRIFVRTASGWTQPTTSAYPFVLGGFDAQRQWVLTQGVNRALTAIPINAGGLAGTPVAGTDQVAPLASALNGTADRFQVVANARAYVVTPTAITRGDMVPGEAYAAPGSPSVIVAALDGRGGARRLADGVLGEILLPSFPQDLDGRHLDFLAVRPSPDTQHIALVIGSDVDGYAILSVRILDLPYAADPFLP